MAGLSLFQPKPTEHCSNVVGQTMQRPICDADSDLLGTDTNACKCSGQSLAHGLIVMRKGVRAYHMQSTSSAHIAH
eukprot:scaffold6817_cov15-Prasinocladus_malaysianus.AAC.1